MSKKMKKDHARVPSGASHGQNHNFLSTNLPAAILVAALLIFWQAAAMGIDAAYILPSPTQVVVRLWELRGPLFKAHLPATMSVVGIGLLISIILGLGLAVLMDASETAEKALYPLIISGEMKDVMDKIIAKHPEYKSYAQAFAGVVERGIRVFEEE